MVRLYESYLYGFNEKIPEFNIGLGIIAAALMGYIAPIAYMNCASTCIHSN